MKKLFFMLFVLYIQNSVYAHAGEWKKTNNGCLIWDDFPNNKEVHEWSGLCRDGYVNGHGKLTVLRDGRPHAVIEGELKDGRFYGHAIFTYSSGTIIEGNIFDFDKIVDGRIYYSNGKTYIGQLLNGKPTGAGKYTYPNGSTEIVHIPAKIPKPSEDKNPNSDKSITHGGSSQLKSNPQDQKERQGPFYCGAILRQYASWGIHESSMEKACLNATKTTSMVSFNYEGERLVVPRVANSDVQILQCTNGGWFAAASSTRTSDAAATGLSCGQGSRDNAEKLAKRECEEKASSCYVWLSALNEGRNCIGILSEPQNSGNKSLRSLGTDLIVYSEDGSRDRDDCRRSK